MAERKAGRKTKCTRRMIDKICELVKTDEFTNQDICKAVGIHESTFYEWLNTKPEFSEAFKAAEDSVMQKRLETCERSLQKLIRGYEYDEVTTDYVPGEKGQAQIRVQHVTHRVVGPSLGAIIHYQTNRDAKNWANRQRQEITGADGADLKIKYRPLTEEELEALREG